MVAHCHRFALLRISRTRDLQRAEQYFRLRPLPRPETFGGTAFRQSNLAQTVTGYLGFHSLGAPCLGDGGAGLVLYGDRNTYVAVTNDN